MSEMITLANVLKEVQSSTAFSGLTLLCVNAAGELRKPDTRSIMTILYSTIIDVEDLNELYTPGIYSTGNVTIKDRLPALTGWNACLVEVFKRGSYTYHRITNPQGDMAVRAGTSSGWGTWKIYQHT